MNYFEVHNGDWELATSHLSACEEGMLLRLRRRYYATEKPLDAEVSRLQRLVRARTKDEKQAVVDVLKEFFVLRDDGWHDEKINRAIEEFLAGAPEREVKKANEDNRLKRHREERARLFKIITDAGEHAPWNVPIAELRELAKSITDSTAAPETATPPATGTATPATATHSPSPISHFSIVEIPGANAPLSQAAPATGSGNQLKLVDPPPTQPPTTIPPCPVKQLVELFIATCPTLPRPRLELWKDSNGATAMRQRWKWVLSPDTVREDGSRYATTAAEAIAWFTWFFESVAASDFLTGRSGGWGKCDLAWLMKLENFMKVVQGNYDNKPATPSRAAA